LSALLAADGHDQIGGSVRGIWLHCFRSFWRGARSLRAGEAGSKQAGCLEGGKQQSGAHEIQGLAPRRESELGRQLQEIGHGAYPIIAKSFADGRGESKKYKFEMGVGPGRW
jgi:hypothetical protein